MNSARILLPLLLAAGIARHNAQDNPAPPPAIAPPQTEMQKWIATTDAPWQAAFKRDVSDAFENERHKLKVEYAASLDAAVRKASAAGDLQGAVALRDEQRRFLGTNDIPVQDDASDLPALKQHRTALRTQLARADKDRATRAKALHAKYDQVLAQAQTQLTQHQRIDDALMVKAKRDELASS